MQQYIKKLVQLLGLTSVKQVNKEDYSNEEMLEEKWEREKIEKLFDKEQIKGSPFWAIGNKQSGYYLTIRNIRLSEKCNSIKEVKEYLNDNMYNCIISAVLCIIDVKVAEEKGRENGTLNHNHKKQKQ